MSVLIVCLFAFATQGALCVKEIVENANQFSNFLGATSPAYRKCGEYRDALYPRSERVAAWHADGRVAHEQRLRTRCRPPPRRSGRVAAAQDGQLPYLALLGYGEAAATARWVCAGTLVSERYILTSAQCTCTQHNGKHEIVSLALLGATHRSDPTGTGQTHGIEAEATRRFPCGPQDEALDIALLKTTKMIEFGALVAPACLDLDGTPPAWATVAGWTAGAPDQHTSSPDLLHTFDVDQKMSLSECPVVRGGATHTSAPPNATKHWCYGSPIPACEPEAGHPLLAAEPAAPCMVKVVGVATTPPRAAPPSCAPARPVMYTRVRRAADWITHVVWGEGAATRRTHGDLATK